MRVFDPTLGTQTGKPNAYDPRQLLLEAKLEGPILQLAAGRFTEARENSLAVLHPRSLAVYIVVAHSTRGSSSPDDALLSEGEVLTDQPIYHIEKVYEHTLNRAAFNFCTGLFGNGPSATQAGAIKAMRERICVQSIDGELTFLEGNTVLYVRHSKEGLVPGPLIYVPEVDSFFTVDANMELQCIPFHVIVMCEMGVEASGGMTTTAPAIMDRGKGPKPRNDLLTVPDGSLNAMDLGLTSVHKRRRVVEPVWSLNLGEHATALFQCRVDEPSSSGSGIDVVVCGESTIFHIDADTGILKIQRRIEVDVATAQSFPVFPMLSHTLMLTHQNTMSVYRGAELIWTAKLNPSLAPVVQSAVATFKGVAGLIVLLRDNGELSISYLGTTPGILDSRLSASRELDFERVDAELKQTQKRIRALTSGKTGANLAVSEQLRQQRLQEDLIFANHAPDALLSGAVAEAIAEQAKQDLARGSPVLTLKAGVLSVNGLRRRPKPHFDPKSRDDGRVQNIARVDGEPKYAAIDLTLEWTIGSGGQKVEKPKEIEQVQISVRTPPGLVVDEESFAITGSSSARRTLYIAFSSVEFMAADTQITITASYLTPEREPRVVSIGLDIPLDQLVSLRAPVRESPAMCTLDVNRQEPILLVDLFCDLVNAAANAAGIQPGAPHHEILGAAASRGLSTHAVGLAYPNGATATILLSKRASRYRIQASSFGALAHMVNEVYQRLLAAHRAQEENRASISPEPQPPLQVSIALSEAPIAQYMEVIDQHLALRQEQIINRELLDKQCQLYRAIQRRLLQRKKDKLPSGLDKLDILLMNSAEAIKSAASKLASLSIQARRSLSEVWASTNALVLILRLWLGLDTRHYEYLRSVFPTNVDETEEMGWIEMAAQGIRNTIQQLDAPETSVSGTVTNDNTQAKITNLLAASTDSMNLHSPISLAIQKDGGAIGQRLRWLLQMLCDKLAKGYRLRPPRYQTEATKPVVPSGATAATATATQAPSPSSIPESRASKVASSDGQASVPSASSLVRPKQTVVSQLPANIHIAGPSIASLTQGFELKKDTK